MGKGVRMLRSERFIGYYSCTHACTVSRSVRRLGRNNLSQSNFGGNPLTQLAYEIFKLNVITKLHSTNLATKSSWIAGLVGVRAIEIVNLRAFNIVRFSLLFHRSR